MAHSGKITFTLAVTIVLLCFSLQYASATGEPVIAGLTAQPGSFDSIVGSTSIDYELINVSGGQVCLDIFNRDNVCVRSIDGGLQNGGHHSIVWDGDDSGDIPVQEGYYRANLSVAVKTDAGLSILYAETTIHVNNTPVVISISPEPAASDVPATAEVHVAFSEVVDPSTLTQENFSLADNAGNRVAGNITIVGRLAIFHPASALAPGTAYTATITRGVRDLTGNALRSEHVWSFTIGVPAMPGIISVAANPGAFNSSWSTAIEYTLVNATYHQAWLNISDREGRHVRTVFCGVQSAASGRVIWDGDDQLGVPVPEGTYSVNLSVLIGGPSQPHDLALQWGYPGTGPGNLSSPGGLAVDRDGNVYEVDSGNARIQKFDSAGTYLMSWGTRGAGDGQFSDPAGIDVDRSGNVYVADTGNHRVQKFDAAGRFLAAWNGSEGVNFASPVRIATDSAGDVYVADTRNNDVQKLDPSGKLLYRLYTLGTTWLFSGPHGLAVDSADNLYVADPGHGKIQKFDPSGKLLARWISGAWEVAIDDADNLYAFSPYGGSYNFEKFDVTGRSLSSWCSPFGPSSSITADASGNVYVSNSYGNSIAKLVPPGVVSPTNVFLSSETTVAVDLTPPRLLSTSPSDGVTGIPVTSEVRVVFSEAVKPDTLGTANFWVADSAGYHVPGSARTDGSVCVFVPSADLKPASVYTATLTGVRDFADNRLQENYVWNFTTVDAPPAIVSITGPVKPVLNGTPAVMNATFTDPGPDDSCTAVWDWGDSTTSAGSVVEDNCGGTVTGSHIYASPGLYTVMLTVLDRYGANDTRPWEGLAIYEPGGFALGAGWIYSPAGTCAGDPSAVGNAMFSFNSEYKKGATTPTGTVMFRFRAGDLELRSTTLEWLMVADNRSWLRGTGTINGTGNYQFIMAVSDSHDRGTGPDCFRIRVWNENSMGLQVIYDNQPGAPVIAIPESAIGGGFILVHPRTSLLLGGLIDLHRIYS